jgi:pimeloyl-ACP methyl ester carboxylesterase
MLVRVSTEVLADTGAALLTAELDEDAAAVRVPTLCLAGAQEPEAARRRGKALAACIGTEPPVEIDGAAQMLPVTQPGPLAAALLGFLERIAQA